MSSIPGRTMCSGIFPIICLHFVLNFGFYGRFLLSLWMRGTALFPPGGGGGGVLKEFLAGDVPLGPWNP